MEEGKLKEHHCRKLKKLYQSNRTEIIWTSGDIAQFNKHAPKWVQRILTAGCETGLRAADLVQVKMDQFEDTPHGKRLRFRTSKRGQIAYIPATSALEKLIAETPEEQEVLLVSELGRPLTARWASNQITKWRREAQISSVDRRAREDFVRYTRDSRDQIAECRSVFAPDRGADGVVGALRGTAYRALCPG